MVARRKDAAGRADPRRAKKHGSPGMARRSRRPARAPLCPNLKRIAQEVWSGGRWLFSAGGAWLRRVFAALRRHFARRPARAAATTTPSSSSPRGGLVQVDADLSSSPPGGPRRDEIGGSSLPAGRAPNRAPPAGPHGNSAPPSGCPSHAAPPAGLPLAHTGRPSIDAARAQPAPRNTAERVVATTAPHGGAPEGGASKRRRVDADEGPSAKQVRGEPSDHRASRRQEDGEGSYALDGDIYGAADIDAPHSSNAASPSGIPSCTAPGAKHHAELVFEEAIPDALFPDASVRLAEVGELHAAGVTPTGAHAAERVVATTARHGDADEGPVKQVHGQPSDHRTSRRQDVQGSSALDDDIYGAADIDAPPSNAAPPAGILSCTAPGQLHAPGAQHHADLVLEEAPHAGLHSNTPKRAARTHKKPAPPKNKGATDQLIEDEEYVEEEVDPEREAHRNYVKKIAAWRKGFAICLICHLKGEEKEITADNDMITVHCSRVHKGNGFKCKKQGCLARGKTMHDIGLHEIECLRTRQRKC